jgi:hypothetical protein
MFMLCRPTLFLNVLFLLKSQVRVVGIATGYGLNYRGFGARVPVGSRIFSSPRCPDRLWGPPGLLSNGRRGQENVDLYIHSPIRVHVAVLN